MKTEKHPTSFKEHFFDKTFLSYTIITMFVTMLVYQAYLLIVDWKMYIEQVSITTFMICFFMLFFWLNWKIFEIEHIKKTNSK